MDTSGQVRLTTPVIGERAGRQEWRLRADVGLGNVDNTVTRLRIPAATLTNKVINGANNSLTVRLDASDTVNNLPVTKLNGGTGANSGSFWRGDGQWAPPAGGGDVVGPAGSVEGELPLFTGTTGKIIKRCGLTGFVKAAANGAAVGQTQMGAADLATTVISGQTQKTTALVDADEFLVLDSTAGPALRRVATSRVRRLQRNCLTGLKLSNNATDLANDIDIAVGECRSDDNTDDIYLTSVMTKRLDAVWVAGTNQGGRDIATVPADGETFHLYLIKNPTNGAVDAVFTKTYGSPTMPSGYTLKRRILSMPWSVAWFGGWRRFAQYSGHYFAVPNTTDDSSATLGATQIYLAPIPCAPKGFKVKVHAAWWFFSPNGASQFIIQDPDATGVVPGIFSAAANANIGIETDVWTNAAGEVKATAGGVGGWTATYHWTTLGHYDPRDTE